MPYRIVAEGLYDLPFGKGKAFANSGLASKLLGGFQIGGSYERQPGSLLQFANVFYIGTPTEKIKLRHPVYVNNLGVVPGGYNFVQWLDIGNVTATYSGGVCTYTGTGFVTNPAASRTVTTPGCFPSASMGSVNRPLTHSRPASSGTLTLPSGSTSRLGAKPTTC